MFTLAVIPFLPALALTGILVALYYGIVGWLIRRPLVLPVVRSAASVPPGSVAGQAFPEPLIDKPLSDSLPPLQTSSHAGSVEEEDLVFDEEPENRLLREAELAVEAIQETIQGCVPVAGDPEQVMGRVRSLVQHYSFFQDTEYFDAINNFIAIAVERDCGLQWDGPTLLSLWPSAAA